MYAHTLIENGKQLSVEDRFAVISGACSISRSTPHPLEEQLVYVVFDLVDLSGTLSQTERFRLLRKAFEGIPQDLCIVRSETKIVKSIDKVDVYLERKIQEGYEGIILRDRSLVYRQKRSLNMRKYKRFLEQEYEIVGARKDKGVGSEYFVWVCVFNSKEFTVTPEGRQEDKKEWYANRNDYIGRYLTVKYQEATKTGIPRFGIGKGIREDS